MYNKAILIGRLTADPELQTTQSGISVCSFRIACNRRFSGRDGERKADFINIVAWRQTAEFVCKYFSKGRAIGLDGSIQTREYTDKSGASRMAFEVVADNCFFVEGKNAAEGRSNAAPVPLDASPAGDFEEIEDNLDLPF